MVDLGCENPRLPWASLKQLGELCPCSSSMLIWLDPGPQMMSSVTHLLPLFSSPRILSPSILFMCWQDGFLHSKPTKKKPPFSQYSPTKFLDGLL